MTPRLLVLVLITFQLFGGYMILDSFLNHQRDKAGCQMSYSRPSFIPIPVPHSRLANKYSLHLYREGGIDPDNQLLGVPALFIPGHAGSYKQARSIAAESAYYYQGLSSKNNRYGLDVFTVDLNEEFSAIAGGLVYDQAEYLNDAIQQILTYYQRIAVHQGRPVPSSVIVVGHSMGGIVARIMQHLPNYVPGSINTIFTLATPHSMPPIILDSSADMIYQRHLSQPLNNTMLVSVAGGTQDIIVNSDAAILPSSMSFGLTVFTTDVPGVWTGCDHMAILWCNQLVKKVAAALVEIVDIRSASQTAPLDKRRRIFEKYLAPTSRVVLDSDTETVTLASDAIHIDAKDRPLLFELSDQHQLVYQLDSTNNSFGILTDVEDLDSLRIRFCKKVVAGLVCATVKSGFQMIPAFGNGEKQPYESGAAPYWLLDVDPVVWNGDDFMVLDYKQHSIKQPFLKIGMYRSSTVRGGHPASLLEANSGYFGTNYYFPDIQSPLLAYKVSLVNPVDDYRPPLIRQTFYRERKFHLVDHETFAPIHLHRGPDNTHSDGLMVTIWSHPNDNHTLQLLIKLDWYGSLGKSVLRLGPDLPMYLFLVSLSFLAHQCTAPSTNIALTRWIGTYSLFSLYGVVLVVSALDQVWPSHRLISGTLLPSFLWWLPLVLFVMATGIFVILSFLLFLIIHGLYYIVPLWQKCGSIHVCVSVLLCSCFAKLPACAVVVLMYFYWLFLCAASYRSVKVSNARVDWIRYQVLFGILMVWTASLPYHIPGTIVYIRDLMVGWHFTSTLVTLLNDAPTIIVLNSLLVTVRFDTLWESSTSRLWLARISGASILYYTLFGIQHPFSISNFLA